MCETTKEIWFIHPDLGIGGAEMLVVNAAVALQNRGYNIRIFTSHHDLSHCFAETRGDGELAGRVLVYGDFFPRAIFGRFHVLFAIIRMLWVTLAMMWFRWFRPSVYGKPSLVFCDQVSHVVPLIRYGLCVPVLFYCHFPDLLLCVDRGSLLKRIYRAPVDWLEEKTTGSANTVLVNSKFTQSVFRETFLSLNNVKTEVLYPAIDLKEFDRKLSPDQRNNAMEAMPDTMKNHLKKFGNESILLLSVNRFERKKNIKLAVESLKELKANLDATTFGRVHLLLAGGYDPRVEENVSYMKELVDFVQKHELAESVSFLKSFTNDQKLVLMEMARCVIYTPDREHFGIVPIEAMYMKCPVVAVASGGPLESVVAQKTGYLEAQNAGAFSNALAKLIKDSEMAVRMGVAGRQRAIDIFSLDAFGDALRKLAVSLVHVHESRTPIFIFLLAVAAIVVFAF